jgi:hypothetical protein
VSGEELLLLSLDLSSTKDSAAPPRPNDNTVDERMKETRHV